MKAKIFDIQRASFVDGPGIRTTVFFQGCNLRCQWCHNPESWKMQPQLMYFENRCAHCGCCAQLCLQAAVAPDGQIDRTRCTVCGACALACPHDARQICGREEETDSLVNIVLRDRSYYEKTGGGLTVSGGECMLQPDALYELLRGAHDAGVSTAVDTAGNVSWACFEKVLPVTDLFLYDIKCFTPALHERLTGTENARILQNYLRLLGAGKRVIVRIPIVPGYNDIGDEMEQTAAFLRAHAPEKIEPLPYHRLGESKNAALGLPCFKAEIPSRQRMEEIARLFT